MTKSKRTKHFFDEMDKEIAEDKKKQKFQEKKFGKERLAFLEKKMDLLIKQVNRMFTKEEREHIKLTLQVKLKNGGDFGKTMLWVDIPKLQFKKFKNELRK